MARNNSMEIVNIFFLVGWLLVFIDTPIRYPADGKTFFTQFVDPLTLFFIAYIGLVAYAMFWILKQDTSNKKLILITVILFLPFLFSFKEFFESILYCVINFCQYIYPPTLLTYISGTLVSIIPIGNIVYLLNHLKK